MARAPPDDHGGAIVTDDELTVLALVAVATPSLDAPASFAVLTDVLLELGYVTEPDEEPDLAPGATINGYTYDFSTFTLSRRRPQTASEAAWEWAQERTALPFIDRLHAVLESVYLTPPRPFIVPPSMFDELDAEPEWAATRWRADAADPRRSERLGFGGAPLGLRARLRRWER